MTFAHQSKSYDDYEIMGFYNMDYSVFSYQMVISLVLMGTFAVSVVIVIRVFRVFRVIRIIRVIRVTRIIKLIRVIRTMKVFRVIRVRSSVILLFLGVVGMFCVS